MSETKIITNSNVISGVFVSHWAEGMVSTPCTLDTVSGSLVAETADVGDLGSLENENFVAQDGTEYEVCDVCHEYILKAVMIPDDIGKGLHEEKVCSDPECDFNK